MRSENDIDNWEKAEDIICALLCGAVVGFAAGCVAMVIRWS